MTQYNWSEIFKTKSNSELLKIYCGDSFLNFKEQIFAGSELINRGVDHKQILDIADNLSERLKREFLQINNSYKFKYWFSLNSKLQWFGIISLLIGCVILFISNFNYRDVGIIAYIFLPLGIISTSIDFKHKIKKRIAQSKQDSEKIKTYMDMLKQEIYDKLDSRIIRTPK